MEPQNNCAGIRFAVLAVMKESGTAVIAALLGNGTLATIKGVVAAMTGSSGMLAETFHSVADTGAQGLLFLGLRRARRRPDRGHPFGHGKDVYFWSFVVAVMLFTLGGAFSIGEAVHKLRNPGEHESVGWAYAVLATGFVVESITFGVAWRSLTRARRGRSIAMFWRETRDPTLLTVLLENAAALVSPIVAAAGLLLTQMTGRSTWDAIASGVIGVLLIAVAVVLAFENYSLLIGEAAPKRVEDRVRGAIEADSGVETIHSLATMHVGPAEVVVLVTVGLTDRARDRVEATIARLHRRVTEALGSEAKAQAIAIEPSRSARRAAAKRLQYSAAWTISGSN
jgi:cation diffusion facilitator family transporter